MNLRGLGTARSPAVVVADCSNWATSPFPLVFGSSAPAIARTAEHLKSETAFECARDRPENGGMTTREA